jgi:hypothetical protein
MIIFFSIMKPGPPQVLNEVSSRFISVERGDDAVIRAVFCADPRPIRVSWRWAAFQMEAGSGSGRFVAEALHKVSPAILPTPPAIVELVGEDENDEDDVMGNTESSNTNSAYDTAIIDNTSTSSTMHHPRSLEVVPTAQSLVARPPQAVFTYPVHIYLNTTLTHSLPPCLHPVVIDLQVSPLFIIREKKKRKKNLVCYYRRRLLPIMIC